MNPLDRKCPRCFAPSGEPCVKVVPGPFQVRGHEEKRLPMLSPHKERLPVKEGGYEPRKICLNHDYIGPECPSCRNDYGKKRGTSGRQGPEMTPRPFPKRGKLPGLTRKGIN